MCRGESVRVARGAAAVVVDTGAGRLLVAGVELHREHAVAGLNGVLEASSVVVDTSVGSKVNK